MHRNRHIVGFLLILAIVLCSFTGIKTYAAEGYVATPKFSLKRINKGTGVKIVIEKTEGATSYYIYMTKRDNAYSKYLKNKGTYDEIVKYAAANKSKNTVVTLSGLPKGKYSFKIIAAYENGAYYYSDYSVEKSIKIKSSSAQKNRKETTYDFLNVKAGDIIKFGAYEQDGNMLNGKEPIEWIVLAKNKDNMFLLSKEILDCVPYNNKNRDNSGNNLKVTWAKSTLRKWMNGYFYKNAFTKNEQSLISTVKLSNKDNKTYKTEGGKSTKDKVFVLSIDEITDPKYGFPAVFSEYGTSGYHRSEETTFCQLQGCNIIPYTEYEYYCESSISYWLRSPGSDTNFAAIVDQSYGFRDYGDIVSSNCTGVRPAICINISNKKQDKVQTLDNMFKDVKVSLSDEEIRYYKSVLNDVKNQNGEFSGWMFTEFGLFDLNGDKRKELVIVNFMGAHALATNLIYTYDGDEFHRFWADDEISLVSDNWFYTYGDDSEYYEDGYYCYEFSEYYSLSKDGSYLSSLCSKNVQERLDRDTYEVLSTNTRYSCYKYGNYVTISESEYNQILKDNDISSKSKTFIPEFYIVNDENINKIIK